MDTYVESQLDIITRRIVEAFNPQKIILFGSHAYGQPTHDSDVDILIIMESQERPTVRAAKVSRLLRPRPFPLDILVRTPDEIHHRLKIGDHFIQEIVYRGNILYER